MPVCPRCSMLSARLTAPGAICDACALEDLLTPALLELDESFGPYRILCEIAEGGLGIVYLAEQLQPIRREVALKVIKPAVPSREILARFETERQTLALLDHPHIARVFEAGTSSRGRPWVSMEFVDGLAITEHCDARSLDIRERITLLADVCRAVDYAHRKGILHRDLKPSNILIGESGGKPCPKIIDFGIAKASQGYQTEAGQLLGTIEYMSPEQAGLSSSDLGAATDVYSLGVVLYELLCGTLPFDSDRLRQAGVIGALNIVRDEEPPSLITRLNQSGPAAKDVASKRHTSMSGLERQLARDLPAIIHKALEKDPRQRYPSAQALAGDLERYLRDEPVLAHAPGLFYRAGKFAKRRRGLIAALACTVAVVAGAAFFVSTARVSGSAPKMRPLTSYPGYQLDPALSPDGNRLAFSWNGEGNTHDIYVKPLDGGEAVRLTYGPRHALHPSWSPDGGSIAFLRVSPAKQEVFIVPAAGGPERRTASVSTYEGAWEEDASVMGRSPGPTWSPDGQALAIADRPSAQGPTCIYLVSPANGAKRRLTSPEPDSVGDSLPAFSPSGRSIAFVRATSRRGITDIYTVRAAGGETRRVTFDSKTISGLSWSAENRLVFTSNREGGTMLWSISARDGTPELIAGPGRNVRTPSALPKLHRLVLTEFFRDTNVWRIDLSRSGSPAERLIAAAHRNDSPKYSPDGKHIVFVSDRSGTDELWVSDADGLHARQITQFGGLPVGTPRWSPDGSRIAFDSVKDGRSGIYIVDAGGGLARLFAKDPWDDMMPSWSQDARYIYYTARREGDVLRVWKKRMDGGPATQLTHLDGGEAVEAPDGRLVYFSDGRNGIWQVSPDGENEAPVPGLERVRDSRYFAVTGKGAYFLRDDQPPWVIVFYDFNTHVATPIARIEKLFLFGTPDLSVSQDDRWLLFSKQDYGGSNILMLDDFR